MLSVSLADWAALLAAIAAALAALFTFLQSRQMKKQNTIAEKVAQAGVFMDIADRWGDVYRTRNELRTANFEVHRIMADYKSIDDYLASDEWHKIRNVAGFYERVGTLVKRGYLPPDVLLDMISVDERLWARLEPLITYLRGAYLPQLYVNYEYLVVVAQKKQKKLALIADTKAKEYKDSQSRIKKEA